MIRQMNLEHQRLVVKIKAPVIRIREVSAVQEPILGNEVIVAETEHEPFVVISDQAIHWDEAYAFPFLVQEAGVLGAAVVDRKAVEL